MTKSDFKSLLLDKTGCRIQHTGWPCGTCFFSINKKLNNRDWQSVLYYRGDYKREELDNIPADDAGIEQRIERIIKIITQ